MLSPLRESYFLPSALVLYTVKRKIKSLFNQCSLKRQRDHTHHATPASGLHETQADPGLLDLSSVQAPAREPSPAARLPRAQGRG